MRVITIGLFLLLSSISSADASDAWKLMPVPGAWEQFEEADLTSYNGFGWYRCYVGVPKNWKGKPAELRVEKLDDSHEVYWNGKKVGSSGSFPPSFQRGADQPQRYQIPAEDVRTDEYNVLAIRVYDNDGTAGFLGIPPIVYGNNQAIELRGKWQFRIGDAPEYANAPTGALLTNVPIFTKTIAAQELDRRLEDEILASGALSPEESMKHFQVAEDFKLEQVLAEPIVRQPLYITFDERGRLWLMQYLQYPYPAGLKMVSRDSFWRAVYDKVPPPPPNHFKGNDIISIHEDTDGDGTYDKHKIFRDDLNIATSVAVGRGGVWVLNPPYLLFYPDRNQDDIPDGDPEVHLAGFGIEDTHSATNNLCWGPDGWLYASQGSTVSGKVVRPGIDKQPVHSMGQLIWRYHPETKTYEIFAEGGGNAYGVEIDAQGRIFSGHNGGNTRGFHYVQGGYLQKGFSKHGPLSNPYAFGFFMPMDHPEVPRFTHDFVIYEETSFPPQYRGGLFAVAPLQSHIIWSDIDPVASTFKTVDRGFPVTSKDISFRPVAISSGPDGGLYIADMYEHQISHRQHFEGQVDRRNGRVYRLQAKDAKPVAPFDLGKLSTKELIGVLEHPARWYRQTALRLLGDRKDKSVVGELNTKLQQASGQTALEYLWALNLCGGLDDAATLRSLEHSEPQVRLWAARLACDDKHASEDVARKLAELALHEENVEVRSQLASSARRLPAEQCLAIVRNLVKHDEDVTDPRIPLLIWWAIESKCGTDRDHVLDLFSSSEIWDLPVVREHLLERVMRRFAAAGTRQDLLTCAKLLRLSANDAQAKILMKGFEEAFKGRPLSNLPTELIDAMAERGGASLAIRIRQGNADAIQQALQIIQNEKASKTDRLSFVQVFGEINQPESIPVLLNVARTTKDVQLQTAAIGSLQNYRESAIPETLVAIHDDLPEDPRLVAHAVLASRTQWASQFLKAMGSGQVDKSLVPIASIRKILLHDSDELQSLVHKHWGEVQNATTEDMRKEVARLSQVIASGTGNPYQGKQLYRESCGKCHLLFGEGGNIGPDLTSFKRDDLDQFLLNVVNPSAEIREGFENFLILTVDGRTLNGFIVDKDDNVVVVKGADGQSVIIPQDEIEAMRAVPQSIMPEGLLSKMDDQQIRDLFAYLRTSQPLND